MLPLTVQATREVIYHLIAQNGKTTTLDVKNELRSRNYNASQNDVSHFVGQVQKADNLETKSNGQYNFYHFGYDSNDTKKAYLEKNNTSHTDFVEIIVEGKFVKIFQGKTGADGVETAHNLNKNLLAIREFSRFVGDFVSQGFVQTQDLRPSLTIRQKYGHILGQKAVSAKIGYFNAKKYEQDFEKNGAYIFAWDLSTQSLSFKDVLAQTQNWQTSNFTCTLSSTLGEKTTKKDLPNIDKPYFDLDNNNIFEIQLFFAGGQKATFSKFSLSLNSELLPLVRQFLS